jgi:hypothetical protein
MLLRGQSFSGVFQSSEVHGAGDRERSGWIPQPLTSPVSPTVGCRPSVVFTSLALFNVLIAPLNAFPWVVNGVVEAMVSLKRIQTYLLLPQRCPNWAYSPTLLPSILAAQQQQQLVVAAGSSGSSKGRSGCCGRGKGGKAGKQQQSQQGQQLQQQQEMGGCVWVSAGGNGFSKESLQPHLLDSIAAVHFCDASFAWKRVSVCEGGGWGVGGG